MDEKNNSSHRCQVLEDYLLPFPYHYHGTVTNDWTLMHDGARSHSAANNYLEEIQAIELPWSAKTPDLNPIENVCGIKSGVIYKNLKKLQPR